MKESRLNQFYKFNRWKESSLNQLYNFILWKILASTNFTSLPDEKKSSLNQLYKFTW